MSYRWEIREKVLREMESPDYFTLTATPDREFMSDRQRYGNGLVGIPRCMLIAPKKV